MLAAGALSCGKAAGPAPAPAATTKPAAAAAPPAIEPDFDADNLLNLAYGACVVSRTAEFGQETSAAHAIDGISTSYWNSPPAAASQTFVFSFLAPARVSRLGVTPTGGPDQTPARVRFEASSDGHTWREAGVVEPRPGATPQIFDVKPFTAQYLRVTVEEPSEYYAFLRSIQAIGAEIEAPHPASPEGCWQVNGLPARFDQEGARIRGVIDTNPPTYLEGGTDGRVTRLLWTRGPMWGHAAVTTSPDGAHLTGILFHEEIDIRHLGAAFFGERCAAGTLSSAHQAGIDPAALLARTGRFTLFGLAFDPAFGLLAGPSASELDAVTTILRSSPSQRFRVIAHELRAPSPEQNQQSSAARIDSIRAALQSRGVDLSRVDFVAAGSTWSGPSISSALQRLLASRIDLERAR